MRRDNTAIPPDLILFVLDEAFWSLLRNGFFVAENEQRRRALEDAVDVFEGAACGFGV